MSDDTSAELLHRLLDACNEGNTGAMRLAQQTEVESIRIFLQESAQQYRRAADDLRTVLKTPIGARAPAAREARSGQDDIDEGDDIVARWERAECHALTYFRDAFDSELPSPAADAVKRHFEAGIDRLERLRKLQTQR